MIQLSETIYAKTRKKTLISVTEVITKQIENASETNSLLFIETIIKTEMEKKQLNCLSICIKSKTVSRNGQTK